MVRSTIGAAIVMAAIVGCGGGGGTGKVCAPGASVSCTCTTGQMGAQVCTSDGAGYGSCMCSGGPGAAGTTGSAGSPGTAGTTGSAGSTGGAGTTGGTGGATAACPSNFPSDLLSDFEVDASLAEIGGRKGTWSAYGDSQGTFSAMDIAAGNPNCSAAGAFHVKGSGFSSFASLFVDFKPRLGSGDKATIDVSGYRGVSFWAKTSTNVYRVVAEFSDIYSDGAAPPHDMADPANPGSNLCTACRCVYNAASPLNCSPYGADARDLDSTWRRFEVLFTNTSQDPANPGYHPPANKLDTTRLASFFIKIVPPQTTAFEIWIDDVSLVR
jgi:hypothetical protein